MPDSGERQAAAPVTRGIYDCDAAYRSPLPGDYEQVFQSGMVVLDTNVLLNLYRSNERTRSDTLAVLSKLRDRLWVPHQVLTEFWRNRELRSVRDHHSAKAKEVDGAFVKVQRSVTDAVERWTKDVRLKAEEEVSKQIKERLATLGDTLEGLREIISEQAERDALAGTAYTHTDPVLAELEPLLQGHIGEPLPQEEYDRAVQEAQKRAEDAIPPGYEDFRTKGSEQGAGDYVLWLQLLHEARKRRCPVLLVTGDVKKDWWTLRDGEIPARPRPELVRELRDHADVQLYMLTPAELLTTAEDLLEGLQLDEDTVGSLEQLGQPDREEDAAEPAWSEETLELFVRELYARYPAQAKVIVAAAANRGTVDRATVYELSGYPGDRQLKGFTRPVSTVTKEFVEQSVLTGEEPFLLRTIYGSVKEPSWATGFRVPDEVIPLVRQLFEGTELWPGPSRSEQRPESETDLGTGTGEVRPSEEGGGA